MTSLFEHGQSLVCVRVPVRVHVCACVYVCISVGRMGTLLHRPAELIPGAGVTELGAASRWCWELESGLRILHHKAVSKALC